MGLLPMTIGGEFPAPSHTHGRHDRLEPMTRTLPTGWPEGRDFGRGTIDVRDPFSGGVIGRVHVADAADVDAAVTAAHRHLPPPPAASRAVILERAARIVGERSEDLARVIALEAAKPMRQARGEVARCVDTLVYSAVEARTLTGEVVPMEGTEAGAGRIAWTVREPAGVIGAISPFNFPLNLVAHKVGPAIAAGCPIVLKPAPQTPFSAIGLAAALTEAGLPDGWLHVLPGDAEVGRAIVEHPGVPLISFTGSDTVGRAIQASVPAKRVLLELGNATPVIVAADADLDDAARRIAASGFTHAGQSCVSCQRVYVERAAHDDFRDLLVRYVEPLRCGDPLDDDTDVGPVISRESGERIMEWIEEARTMGGRVRTGGRIADGIIEPTVITELPPDCAIATREVFGPVIGVAAVDDLDEAVRLANATPLGLQAGVFTSRADRAVALARDLDVGGVIINDTPTYRTDQMPYGGVKESGNTREGPACAVREMTVPKLVVMRLPS